MKKFFEAKWILAAASLFSMSILVACGASNTNTAPLIPLSGGLATGFMNPCPVGQINVGAGCVPYNGAASCVGAYASMTTASDGASVCRISAPIQEVFQNNGSDFLGPSGGGGINVGSLMPGDNVVIAASGNWGTNTCNFNFCWGNSCSCSCSGGASVSDGATGLYGEAAGTILPIQSSASFQVGQAPTSLVVGFNAPSMKCYNLQLNVTVTRCIDAQGLTHPCH